jgi:O-antigen ligase
MTNFLTQTDALAGINLETTAACWLERIAFTFLFLMVVTAPHSIAASQTSYILGIVVTVVRLFVSPRPPRLKKTLLDIALWTFFGWTVFTCLFSYYPLVSLDKLRGAGLFLIFYFVIQNLRNLRALRFLVLALIFSCMINVLWTPIERFLGRGVEIHGISPESPLKKALLWEGDTLLSANGKKIKTPDDLVAEIEKSETAKVGFYRPDFYFSVDVNRADLLNGDALNKLGIESWKKSRNWRAQGFFSHYVTYAEVLQLIISLCLGLFIVSIGFKSSKRDLHRDYARDSSPNILHSESKSEKFPLLPVSFSPVLFLCLIGLAFALLLTVTRASQLSFLISALAIVIFYGNRKIILMLAVIIVPVALIGLFLLQQSRQVGFFDNSDTSTTYRMTVYREGMNLWLDNPKHFFLGVGMDAITQKEFREKWQLFDNGKLPVGHFHSTPIQMLVERGLFGLILWLIVFIAFFRILFAGLKRLKKIDEVGEKNFSPLRLLPFTARQLQLGVLLGCIGATVGFFTSSLVHYNFGDGEVVMVLFIVFGFGFFAATYDAASGINHETTNV